MKREAHHLPDFLEHDDDRLIDEREAARFLSCSRGYLRRSRMVGNPSGRNEVPPFVRVGKRGIRYCLRDLRDFVQRNRVER